MPVIVRRCAHPAVLTVSFVSYGGQIPRRTLVILPIKTSKPLNLAFCRAHPPPVNLLAPSVHFADTGGVRLRWAKFGAWSGSSLFQAGNPDDQGDTLMLDERDATRLWRQIFRG
jgi:hypothetical protein